MPPTHPRLARSVPRHLLTFALLACAGAAAAEKDTPDIAQNIGPALMESAEPGPEIAENGGPALAETTQLGPAIAENGGPARTEIAQPARELATTFYVAEISSESGWEDVVANPVGAKYIGAYLAVAALSKTYAHRFDGQLGIEWEGQVAYNFGDQDYWEFNFVPVVARWRLDWFEKFATSAAFGLGLSYTTEMPRIEVELEGESSQSLIYWVMELTAGPHDAPWAMSLRLHHRSVGYGLMGDDGGMNALGMGMRWRF
jgi:hypothetical protein